jgi:CRP-like cAMP-binding protein
MYFAQKDLFTGLGKGFIKQLMEVADRESYEAGSFLFQEGDQARHFYILLKGHVKLSIGIEGHTVYRVNHPGEAFGWSSLLGREEYSASAQCVESTKILKYDVDKINRIIEKDSENGCLFFKQLSRLLGSRLIQSYQVISSEAQTVGPVAFGTGQVIESETTTS